MKKTSPSKTSVTYVTVNEDDDGRRLDNFIQTALKSLPKRLIYKIIRKGEVRVNKKRAKVSDRVRQGDIVRLPPVMLEEKQLSDLKVDHYDITDWVLYENDDLLVMNKPSGLPVHGGNNLSYGLIDILRKKMNNDHLELVHRLDQGTSGCLMIAKNPITLRYLHTEFREGRVEKYYRCLVKGLWPKALTRVNAPLRKESLSSRERIVRVDRKEGKEAITHFKVLNSFHASTLLEVKLETGRTHQIRVHTQISDHPIAGDPKYGDDDFNASMRDLGLKRMFLHASLLRFQLPDSDEKVTVEAPLDPSLASFLELL